MNAFWPLYCEWKKSLLLGDFKENLGENKKL